MELFGFTAGPFQTNTYVIAEGRRAFIVDPGMDAMGKVLEHDLDYEAIVLTHGHIDHTRDAGSLAEKLDIPVYIHPADKFMLASGEGVSPQAQELFDAAHAGALDTEDLAAKKGRASYLGDRSKGVIDPGAIVVSWLFGGEPLSAH